MAGVVIPFPRVPSPLDVDLHTVLLRLLVVGLPIAPVLGLCREGLVGAHPSPHPSHSPDAYPVVRAAEGEGLVQVLNFPLVLNGNQIGVTLLAELPRVGPGHGVLRMMVSPAVGSVIRGEIWKTSV